MTLVEQFRFWLNVYQALEDLKCLRRGPGGDRDPRKWGRRETIPNATLSPPE